MHWNFKNLLSGAESSKICEASLEHLAPRDLAWTGIHWTISGWLKTNIIRFQVGLRQILDDFWPVGLRQILDDFRPVGLRQILDDFRSVKYKYWTITGRLKTNTRRFQVG